MSSKGQYTIDEIATARHLVASGMETMKVADLIGRTHDSLLVKNRNLAKQGLEPMWPVDEGRSASAITGNGKFSFHAQVPEKPEDAWELLNPNYA